MPAAGGPSWREIFDRNRGGEPIVAPPSNGHAAADPAPAAPLPATAEATTREAHK